MKEKIDIRNISVEELQKFCKDNNLPKFRAKQVEEWLWKKGATSFAEMTSLSKEMRDLFTVHFVINSVKIHKAERSIDGTIKYSMKLHDNQLVEGVLIPSKKRITACISSQVGCSLDCAFCATGTLKLERNLTAAEIYDQVFILNEESISSFGKSLSNIVYMGMGEPLMNRKALHPSLTILNQGYGVGARRITVSTVGVVPGILELAEREEQFRLAVSLHAPNDELRSQIMPINNKYPISELLRSVQGYMDSLADKRVPVIEYTMIKGVNDHRAHARELATLLREFPCKINIIPFIIYNSTFFSFIVIIIYIN